MKKRMAALLFAGIMAASLAGCSSKPAETTAAANEAATEAAAETKAEETAAEEKAAETVKEAAKPDNFPKKNIKIIVPYDAGGGVDITTRILAEAAGKDYFDGKSLIVENMAGGGAVIGHTAVANADPDGYTLLAYTSAVVNNPLLKDVTYTLDSFKTLGMVCFDPEILVVPPTAEYKTYEEFIEYAKTHTVKVATPGHSTAHHIAAIQFAKDLGLNFEYLHNDSASVQMQQLMGGHCDAAFMGTGETVSQIKDGTIIGLAMGGEERNADIPDVPTFTEKGEDLVAGAFRGYACPAGVPDDVYNYLVSEFDKIITSDKFIDAMKEASIPYAYKNAADFQAYANQCSKDLEALVPELKGN